MARKAKSTQGSKIEVSLTTGGTFTKITGCTAIPRGTGSAQWLDTTDYDSTKKEYIPGLEDVTDVTLTGQRIVDDAGQNMVRDAYYANPKTNLFFKSTTAQGEVFTFESEVASWNLTGDPNAVELFNAGIRPANEEYVEPVVTP